MKVGNKVTIYETELKDIKNNISDIENKLGKAKIKSVELKSIISDDVTKELEEKVKESEDIAKQITDISDKLNKRQIQHGKEDARIEERQKHIGQIEKLGPGSECPIPINPDSGKETSSSLMLR